MTDALEQAMENAPPDTSAATSGGDPIEQSMENAPTTDDLNNAPPVRAPLGPPRLHGQTRLPRPQPTPTPGGVQTAARPAPPAPPEDLSAPAVFRGALENLGPSIGGQIQGVINTALHPRQALSAMNDLGVGLESKFGLIDKGQPAEQAKDQAAVNALGHMYVQRYAPSRWSQPGGLFSTFKHDPAAIGTDIAVPASALAGGEGLLTKLGLPGEVAGAVAKGAGTLEAAVNPIGYVPRAIGLAAKAPGAAIRAARGAGAVSEVEDTLRGLDKAEPIPKSVVTGEAPATEFAPEVERSVAGWRQKVAQAANGMTGGEAAPHPTSLGEAYEDAQLAAHNQGVDNYNGVRQYTDTFDPAPFNAGLGSAVDTAFANAKMPPVTGPGGIATLPETYGQTAKALESMHNQIGDLAAHNALTPDNLMNVRQNIGGFYRGARGSDVKGLRTLQEAFDNHIADSAAGGLYQGPNGAQVAADMRGAIDHWRTYNQTFNEGPASKVTQTLRDAQDTDPTTGHLQPSAPGTAEKVTGQLGKGLINPNLSTPIGASQLHGHLANEVFGAGTPGGQALNDYVRQSVTKLDSQGNLIAKPEQIHRFLNLPLARSVFPDAERAQVGKLANAEAALTARPTRGVRDASLARTIGRHVGSQAARYGAAWVGEKLLPGPIGAMAGFSAEAGLEHVLEAIRKRATFLRPAKAAARRSLAQTIARRGAVASVLHGATPQSPEEQQQEADKSDKDIVAAAPPVEDVAKNADMGKAPAANPTDIDAVVRMAAAEGDPTPESWAAIAAVMRNRALEGGHSLSDVASEPGRNGIPQFNAYGNRNYTSLQPGSPRYNRILAAIAPILAGKEDPTGGSDSYYAPDLQAKLGRPPPSWDDGSGQMIGTQRFFKGKYRRPHAAGGVVLDLTQHLMKRAEGAQKAAQASTRPLLGLSDDTVAQALRVAQRGL